MKHQNKKKRKKERNMNHLHNHNNLIRLRAHMHSYGYINSLNIYLQKSTKETERVFSSCSRRLTGELIV